MMMRRLAAAVALTLALSGAAWLLAVPSSAGAADSPSAKGSPITGKPPLQVVATAPKGSLHNPYAGNAAMAAAGHKLFFNYGCNGCHGGDGGGGICPPLINGVWIYGGSDDTLFRLVSLGSVKLQAAGYYRQTIENVVAPMPSMGPVIKSDSDLWKIITWIRSAYDGPPDHKYK
jgi:mono/diheme cytochrome c family protein